MTTTEPTAPTLRADQPDTDDPLADLAGEAVTLYGKGWARLTFQTSEGEFVEARLRPPLFGEYKRLRGAMDAITEEVADMTDGIAAVADRIEADAKDMDEDEALTDRERTKRRRALQRESAREAKALNEKQEALWLGWWAQTITALCVDTAAKVRSTVDEAVADHDRLPPYMAAGGTAMRLLGHWRAGPLGRG